MFDILNFSIDENQQEYKLAKKALVFVSGTHKDSMGRVHNFDESRVQKFVQNTNNFISQGGRIPFLTNHQKTQEAAIGDVEGQFYTKVITESDLPNPNCKHLVGKLGVFVDNIVGKGKDVVQKIKDGLIKTLSPGLDPLTETFIEVSATPTPAIIGPALFSTTGDAYANIIEFEYDDSAMKNSGSKENTVPVTSNSAFSFDELYAMKKNKEAKEEEYEELSENLFKILCAISEASEEELAAKDLNPIEASYDAIEYFLSSLEEMFNLTEVPEEDIKNKYTANGARNFPTGKTPSEYKKSIQKNVIEFKKHIGFVLK